MKKLKYLETYLLAVCAAGLTLIFYDKSTLFARIVGGYMLGTGSAYLSVINLGLLKDSIMREIKEG